MMSTCQVGINDDNLGKKSGARRAISIIRNFEAQWRPIGTFDFGLSLSTRTPHRPDDRTAAISAHQNAAYRVALLLAIGIGATH
jgi:hypothetical protein